MVVVQCSFFCFRIFTFLILAFVSNCLTCVVNVNVTQNTFVYKDVHKDLSCL